MKTPICVILKTFGGNCRLETRGRALEGREKKSQHLTVHHIESMSNSC